MICLLNMSCGVLVLIGVDDVDYTGHVFLSALVKMVHISHNRAS
jgi:hypothetical protein